MLKNKLFIFFIILFCAVLMFSPKVFASTDRLSFTGYDGVLYELPPLPDELNDYNHYVIVFDTLSGFYYLVPFNETFEIQRNGNFNTVLCDGSNFSANKYFTCLVGDSSWSITGNLSNPISFQTYMPIIYSCSCIRPYSIELNEGMVGEDGFFLSRPEVLVPIMEKTPLEMVLQEIAEILPVVLVIIVGLIGLRKALAFLQKVLHRS